jgi:hypothetical protein
MKAYQKHHPRNWGSEAAKTPKARRTKALKGAVRAETKNQIRKGDDLS